MARRPFWNGYLKLSLVTCPVTLTPATSESEKVRFRILNRETGNPVTSRYIDAETGKPVKEGNEVKGYAAEDGKFVLLEDEELEAVALESTRTIEIESFVPEGSISWLYYDKPHYLLPGDEVANEAYCVIRDAMAATKTVAISRLVLYRRERPIMLAPHGEGIVVWTLRYGSEVRQPPASFDRSTAKPDKDLLKLVEALIKEKQAVWKSGMVDDPVQQSLLDIIKKKRKGQKAPARKAEAEERPANVISIIDALKKSIASEQRGKR